MRRMMMGCVGGRIRTANITNMVVNGNFVNDASWAGTGAEFTVSANVATFRGNSAQDTLAQVRPFVIGRKYYLSAQINTGAAGTQLRINDGLGVAAIDVPNTGIYEFVSILFTAVNTSASGAIYLIDFRSSGWTNILMKYVSLVELTTPFSANNEPTKADMDAYMAAQANKWLNGTQAMTLYY